MKRQLGAEKSVLLVYLERRLDWVMSVRAAHAQFYKRPRLLMRRVEKINDNEYGNN